MVRKSIALLALLATSGLTPAATAQAGELADAIAGGDPALDFRYRLELVDQTGLAENASASTLRTRLGYRTKSFEGLSAFIQFENVFVVGQHNFNNTINGKVQYPVVADPSTTELNQAYVQFQASDDLRFRAGREAINLGNLRFVGTVGWRQNDQTYDNINASYSVADNMTLTYAYVWQVNRIFSSKHALGQVPADTHLVQADYKLSDLGTLTAYGYMIDINAAALSALSRNTFGARFAGGQDLGGMKLGYELEYASQSGNTVAAGDFQPNYMHLGATLGSGSLTAGVGWEKLGSDRSMGFATPLATLHKFNGWADKFLGTPGGGLKDMYVKLAWKAPDDMGFIGGMSFLGFYHDFKADVGGADYGSEWDWQVSKPFGGRYAAVVKGAHYNADTFASDTTKIWFMLTAKF